MLCLVGSGEYLPAMEPVDRFLFEQLEEEPRVVCLPTAAGMEGHNRIRYWMDLGTAHYQNMGVQVEALPVVDTASANDAGYAKRVDQANFVYLSGGRPDYLFKVLADSPVWRAILNVYQRGGVLAGCSAGAMIMGKGFLGFPRWQKGFGLLDDGVIVPHFDELPPLFARGMQRFVRRGNTIFGIDGSTALMTENHRRFVRGRGGVTVIHASGSTRYTDGEEIPSLPEEADQMAN